MGEIEQGVRADLGKLKEPAAALVATALRLARTLDDGAGLSTAAVSRELRAVLKELHESTTSAESAVDEIGKKREQRRRKAAGS